VSGGSCYRPSVRPGRHRTRPDPGRRLSERQRPERRGKSGHCAPVALDGGLGSSNPLAVDKVGIEHLGHGDRWSHRADDRSATSAMNFSNSALAATRPPCSRSGTLTTLVSRRRPSAVGTQMRSRNLGRADPTHPTCSVRATRCHRRGVSEDWAMIGPFWPLPDTKTLVDGEPACRRDSVHPLSRMGWPSI